MGTADYKVRVGDDGTFKLTTPDYHEACEFAAELSRTSALRQAYIRQAGRNVARFRDGELDWETA
jgi:hypothetical protein